MRRKRGDIHPGNTTIGKGLICLMPRREWESRRFLLEKVARAIQFAKLPRHTHQSGGGDGVGGVGGGRTAEKSIFSRARLADPRAKHRLRGLSSAAVENTADTPKSVMYTHTLPTSQLAKCGDGLFVCLLRRTNANFSSGSVIWQGGTLFVTKLSKSRITKTVLSGDFYFCLVRYHVKGLHSHWLRTSKSKYFKIKSIW
jgi:hypothetical protein